MNVCVGESRYASAFEKLCGLPSHGGYLVPVSASLVRDPDNAYDSNAIRVEVKGLLVGHIRREIAAYLALILDKEQVTVWEYPAIIRGGATTAPSFGVPFWPKRGLGSAIGFGRWDRAEEERSYLLQGCNDEQLTQPNHVTQLVFDDNPTCEFSGMRFCLTGDFIYGPRASCEAEITRRRGIVANSVTKKLRYLVIGERGSIEWRHGSFGTKIDKAM